MEPFTHQDFIRELMEFRQLMGDRNFWAKTPKLRDIAKKALGVSYLNTIPASDAMASHFEAALWEYDKREQLMFKAGLTKIA